MALFLFRFYPALLPLIFYLIWLYVQRHRARKKGEKLPKFSDGPVYILLMVTLGIAVVCFIILGFSITGGKGSYQPPHMEGNELVPARVQQ